MLHPDLGQVAPCRALRTQVKRVIWLERLAQFLHTSVTAGATAALFLLLLTAEMNCHHFLFAHDTQLLHFPIFQVADRLKCPSVGTIVFKFDARRPEKLGVPISVCHGPTVER